MGKVHGRPRDPSLRLRMTLETDLSLLVWGEVCEGGRDPSLRLRMTWEQICHSCSDELIQH